MRFAITGGTGFIGRALVQTLASAGHDIVVFSRKGQAAQGRIATVAWTPGKEGPWTESLAGVDHVIHLAGAGLFDERWSPERIVELRASRVDATRVLAEALAQRSKTASLVSGSAVGIYGMRKDDLVLDETSEQGPPGDFLADLCREWEAAAEPARAAGLRVTHPRIGLVLGRGGGALEKMLPAFRAFVGGPIGDGKQWFSFVHIDDAVRALIRLAQDDALSGPFNVTAPEPVTMNDFASALARAIHRPALFRVPSFAIKAAMGEGRADALLTGQRVVPKRLLSAGFTFTYPTVEAALSQICR